MGCFSGSKERGLNIDDDFGGPVKQRSCTDISFVILKILFVIGLFGLVGYCMGNGDLYRLFNGYDNCGNVCGRVNAKAKEPGFDCKGGDFTAKKYLKYGENTKNVFDVKHTQRECVANCTETGYVTILHKCFKIKTANETLNRTIGDSTLGTGRTSLVEPRKKNITIKPRPKSSQVVTINLGDFFEEVGEDMGNVWPQLIYLSLIAFGLSLFILLMFRYAAPVMVWATLMLCIIVTTGFAAFLWVMYSKTDSSTEKGAKKASGLLQGGIIMTIVAVLVILIILVMRKRIRLVIQLFEESAKAVAAMPLLFIQPIYTFISLAVIVILWFYFALWIQSSGKLEHSDTYYYYKKDVAMKVARWYNLFAIFWMSQFVISCQHMVLAGAVSTWYFTRDKSNIGAPIWTGFTNLVRYHIGSVLLGSLVMAIIAFIKFLLKMAQRVVKDSNNPYLRCAYLCVQCMMNCVERIFNMISRNAYVEIAIYGKGFCPSALRGIKILFNNAFNVIAINSVGDFVLFMSKLLITVITVLAAGFMIGKSDNIHHPWLPILLVTIFTFFIAHTFVSIFEMIIDTIFICFCEDCEMNDGINKPYFMNRGLMEFVENSKRVLKIKDKDKSEDQNTPK